MNRKFDRFIPSKWIFESEEFIEDNDNGENVDEYEDKNLENILFTEEFETASDQRRFLLSAMSMDEREILEMAESTVGQRIIGYIAFSRVSESLRAILDLY